MRRSLTAALVAIGCVVGVPLVAFATWDAIAFQPHVPRIDAILHDAQRDDRRLAPNVARMLDANVRGSVSPHVGSLLFRRLQSTPGNSVGTRALWAIAVKLHFDSDERIALLAELTQLDRHAHAMYGRDVAALNERDAARVVAMTHAPTIYARSPERLERRAEMLLLAQHPER